MSLKARMLILSLRRRGVVLKADGMALHVDAPAGVLRPGERERMKEHKAELLRMLREEERRERARWERGIDPRWSRHKGYIRLHDPTTGEVHEVAAKDCFESIVQEANANRRKDKEGA